MELVTPGIGLLFWMLVMFGIVLWVLKKFAWKPILNALRDREMSIQDALLSAENARKEMEELKAGNELLLAEARLERDRILKEGKDMKVQMISQAKEEAFEEAKKIVQAAKEDIEQEKNAAILDIKVKVTELSVVIAEKILREKLGDSEEQKQLIDKLMNEIKLN